MITNHHMYMYSYIYIYIYISLRFIQSNQKSLVWLDKSPHFYPLGKSMENHQDFPLGTPRTPPVDVGPGKAGLPMWNKGKASGNFGGKSSC